MNRWQTSLRDGDPIAREPALSPADVERMRRRVLAGETRSPSMGRALAIALSGALALVIGIGAWWSGAAPPAPADTAAAAGSNESENVRRQLQFATPGGTRVIWIFDSNFDVR